MTIQSITISKTNIDNSWFKRALKKPNSFSTNLGSISVFYDSTNSTESNFVTQLENYINNDEILSTFSGELQLLKVDKSLTDVFSSNGISYTPTVVFMIAGMEITRKVKQYSLSSYNDAIRKIIEVNRKVRGDSAPNFSSTNIENHYLSLDGVSDFIWAKEAFNSKSFKSKNISMIIKLYDDNYGNGVAGSLFNGFSLDGDFGGLVCFHLRELDTNKVKYYDNSETPSLENELTYSAEGAGPFVASHSLSFVATSSPYSVQGIWAKNGTSVKENATVKSKKYPQHLMLGARPKLLQVFNPLKVGDYSGIKLISCIVLNGLPTETEIKDYSLSTTRNILPAWEEKTVGYWVASDLSGGFIPPRLGQVPSLELKNPNMTPYAF